MIDRRNYKKYVTTRPLEKGDVVAHDGAESFMVFDGEDFLLVWRDGMNNGRPTARKDFHDNADYQDFSFYRFTYMGNIFRDKVYLLDGDKEQIPADILEAA